MRQRLLIRDRNSDFVISCGLYNKKSFDDLLMAKTLVLCLVRQSPIRQWIPQGAPNKTRRRTYNIDTS